MRRVQQLHLYLGTLFAPLIIFFAFTGALQTLGLHEGPQSAGWIARLAEIHKNQRWTGGQSEGGGEDRPRGVPPGAGQGNANGARPQSAGVNGVPPREGAPGGGSPGGGSPGGERRAPSWPFKWFVVLMAVGLITTTGLGIYMSFKYSKDKRVVWGLLIAGMLLPIVLLFL